MSYRLLGNVGALALFFVTAIEAEAATCTKSDPQVGKLSLHSGSVKIKRRGVSETLASGDIVCLNDEFSKSASAGAIRDRFDTSFPFKAGEQPRAPARDYGVVAWLRSIFLPARKEGRIHSSLSGSEGETFPLAGMRKGTEQIGKGHARLIIPVSMEKYDRSFSLYRAGKKSALAEIQVAAHQRWAVIAIKLDIGSYEFVSDRNAETATFKVLKSTVVLPDGLADLDAKEQALALVCLDPQRHALEAIQRLSEVGAPENDWGWPIEWQNPTDSDLSCATPK